jgi:regulator of replication initiation timing
MSVPPSLSDNRRYEQACDQAIAMCDGNLRSTIKALIMANEYLETELEELQAAISAGCVPAKAVSSEAGTGSREENASKQELRTSSNAA